MNVSIMLDELAIAAGKATENLQMETKHGTLKPPQIVDGYLPPPDPKKPNDANDYPFVIVRYLGDESDTEGSSATVKIIAGAYSQDKARGWREALNLMDVLRTYFSKYPYFGKSFEIELPIRRKMPEEQDAPQWVGELTLNITIPHIVEEDERVQKFFIE